MTYIVRNATFGPKLVRDGLILYLDAANTKSYAILGAYWNDLTTNGHNAELTSYSSLANAYSTDGQGSLVLDSTSYLSINDSAELNRTRFTYSGWLKNEATSLLWNRVISKKDLFNDANGYEITLHTGTSKTLYISGANATFATIDTVMWTNKGWHNLVVIFESTTVTVYCDNSYCGQGTIEVVVPNDRPLFLGKINSEATTQWNGKMANICIYNKALSVSEINQNYNALKGRFGL